MTYWILLCYVAIVFFTLSSCETADPRPLILALPIRIQATRVPYPKPPEDREPEESEEEQYLREQRIVPRTFNPMPEPRYPRQQEENSNPYFQSDFLTWNPGNKFMVLQISDVIGGRKEESSEVSEEVEEPEKVEEPAILTKPGQNWSYQGSYDFEDGRFPLPPTKKEEQLRSSRMPSSRSKKKKKKKKNVILQNHSTEDTENSDVYGTDPVMHFLRSRSKKNENPFAFDEMSHPPPPLPEDEDHFGNWWSSNNFRSY